MPHATSGVLYIILSSRYQMDVGMEYCLPSDLTAVPTDVKTLRAAVFRKSREKTAAGQPILTHVYRFKPGAWPSGSGVQ